MRKQEMRSFLHRIWIQYLGAVGHSIGSKGFRDRGGALNVLRLVLLLLGQHVLNCHYLCAEVFLQYTSSCLVLACSKLMKRLFDETSFRFRV